MLASATRFTTRSRHSFTKRFSHAGDVQAAYTWGKLISNTDNTSSFLDGQGGTGLVQDLYNLKAERSVSEQDIRHNFVANYGLDLPFGHGEMYLSHINAVTNAFVGGWRVNGITTLRSGVPIALTGECKYTLRRLWRRYTGVWSGYRHYSSKLHGGMFEERVGRP